MKHVKKHAHKADKSEKYTEKSYFKHRDKINSYDDLDSVYKREPVTGIVADSRVPYPGSPIIK